ncbi:MAG: hypothetical protein NXI20_03140 [bacterium]|nr:hypothetical protein [bacterium]
MPNILRKYINLGTDKVDSFNDKIRVKIINLAIAGLLLAIPFILTINLLEEDYTEVIILIIASLIILAIWNINIRGKVNLAAILLSILTISMTWLVVLYSDTQIRAPFSNIVFSIGAFYIISHQILRRVILVLGFTSFIILDYYQLENLPFDQNEYFVIILMVIGLFLTIKLFEDENVRYRRLLENKNDQIKKQSEQLLKMEREKHETEVQLKQKDLENVVATQSLQLTVNSEFSHRLKSIIDEKNLRKEVNKVILELQANSDSLKKLNHLQQSSDEVNAAFAKRLDLLHPDLSKSERELCLFLKLGLSTKELANIRHTNENTINAFKSRIRKKIGLNSNKDIIPYLIKI